VSYLTRIEISGLRNLNSVSLSLSSNINLLYGENGSGKTSLLEALSLLGLGRSFRSHKTRSLISHDQSTLTTFAEIEGMGLTSSVGLQKSRNGNTLIRINGQAAPSAAALAQLLPLQILNADSFQLIEGSPLQRRRFLDWMVFHVKPGFIEPWRRLQRLIKQRNSLLRRDKITRLDLVPWDKEFAELSEIIHRMRQTVFEEFSVLAKVLVDDFAEGFASIDIAYLPGWNTEQAYDESLAESFDRDVRDGYTHIGPHRADLKFTAEGKPAAEVLSRGQEKSLIAALHIAQAKLYQDKTKNPCVFLVDDLLAELDSKNTVRLAAWLNRLKGQAFITGVSKELLLAAWETEKDASMSTEGSEIKLFHVEQGIISPVELTN
jgi:DNA replication and repair protein RecF